MLQLVNSQSDGMPLMPQQQFKPRINFVDKSKYTVNTKKKKKKNFLRLRSFVSYLLGCFSLPKSKRLNTCNFYVCVCVCVCVCIYEYMSISYQLV